MLKYLISDLQEVMIYLPIGLIVGLFTIILLSAIRKRRGVGREEIAVFPATCFIIYVVIIACITFFSRESGSRMGFDLEISSTLGINARNNAFVVENVLLFVPFGFLCAWASQRARKMIVNVSYGLLLSLTIELLQLVTGRGFFQIDDIITNVLGTLIGFLIARIMGIKPLNKNA